MTDTASLRQATRKYPYLQGLYFVPIGLWLAAGTLTGSGWWPWKGGQPSRELAVMIPATALAGWGFWKVSHYYQERLGTVVAFGPKVRSIFLMALGIVLLGAAGVADGEIRGPLNLHAITFALLWVAYWKLAGILRRDHLILAAGVLVLSVLPWTTVRSTGAPTTVLGLAMAALVAGAGLLDHAHLMRWLGPTPHQNGAASNESPSEAS